MEIVGLDNLPGDDNISFGRRKYQLKKVESKRMMTIYCLDGRKISTEERTTGWIIYIILSLGWREYQMKKGRTNEWFSYRFDEGNKRKKYKYQMLKLKVTNRVLRYGVCSSHLIEILALVCQGRMRQCGCWWVKQTNRSLFAFVTIKEIYTYAMRTTVQPTCTAEYRSGC